MPGRSIEGVSREVPGLCMFCVYTFDLFFFFFSSSQFTLLLLSPTAVLTLSRLLLQNPIPAFPCIIAFFSYFAFYQSHPLLPFLIQAILPFQQILHVPTHTRSPHFP